MRYDVTGYITEAFTILDVEADSEDDAREIAKSRVENGENHLLGAPVEVDVWTVDETHENCTPYDECSCN